MKAEDLMVGDYISVKPSGMPIKIAAVHHKKVAYHACTDKLSWVRESLLEPIHLTKEILKKNGFRVMYAECRYVHELQHALKLYGIEKKIEL